MINGTGNALNSAITGNTGAKRLSGDGGNDSLTGGAGSDGLNGGLGNDILTGGAGAESFRFDAALSATPATTPSDSIQLENPGTNSSLRSQPPAIWPSPMPSSRWRDGVEVAHGCSEALLWLIAQILLIHTSPARSAASRCRPVDGPLRLGCQGCDLFWPLWLASVLLPLPQIPRHQHPADRQQQHAQTEESQRRSIDDR